ncbi:hypothetical protein GMOD_00003534 [Pyrenophora seminiperda CCB06]|uniref:Uncharacterized protein n=1 Tax=Pyrenophora seminiperda CCB06 TaxID=1302712 RepID=A0A3M7MJ75_9PLEO|nr:hypothetical protein GMOD_00003534 [Pyrenophora seminiperda CCB06]
MQDQHPQDAQSSSTLAPSSPADISSPKKMRRPLPPGRPGIFATRTNAQALTAFEDDLTSFIDVNVAKELVNVMRMITQHGNRRKDLLELRRQRIHAIVAGTNSPDVQRLYSIFARTHAEMDKRTTYQLPIVGVATENAVGESMVDSDEVDMNGTNEAGALDQDVHLPMRRRSNSEVTTNMEAPAASPRASSLPLVPTRNPLAIPTDITCDKHTRDACTIIPIQNPEAFPVGRIQEVQAKYYPSTKILSMWSHQDDDNEVQQVTLDVDQGSVDHLVIQDPQIITHLGLRQPPHDILKQHSDNRIDCTFKIRILAEQSPENPKSWIVGELVTARHAYLYWLDSRQSANPKGGPSVSEAKTLAWQLGRRPFEVMQEVERYWNLEQGSGGRHYRENREKYLGEDPSYPDTGGVERKPIRSRWT